MHRRLGSSLEGAYLIWDDVLFELFDELAGFSRALISSLLQHLSEPSSTVIDAETDVENEALAIWLLHIIQDDEVGKDERLAVEVMKWCCLYPGYWTERVGSEVLEGGSEGLSAMWEDLFEASLLKDDTNGAEEGLQEGQGSTAANLEEQDGDMMIDVDENPSASAGWRRAVLPPTTPIGVVR